MGNIWKNWAGNVVSRPSSIIAPGNESQVIDAVINASKKSQTVRVAGSGHSFTPAVATDGVLLDIGQLSGIYSVDRQAGTVTVGAGTTLNDLNRQLDSEGLAMPNLGDIAYQTVAGAVSTSTHGTGVAIPGLAAQVVGMRLVSASGDVVEASSAINQDVLDVGRVSLGALGVMTQCTLKVVDAFALEAHEMPMKLDDVLNNVHELKSSNDHFEFFWIPHTKWALTKRNNRTTEPLNPLPKVKGWVEKTFMENFAFGALCHLGKIRPSLIPRLATALPSSGSRKYIDQSYKIFASPRLVRFYEMEHSIPSDALPDALREIRAMIERKGYLLNFPVEVRFTSEDNVPLSTSYGRESAYIAVHVFKGMEYQPFFRDVENILRGYEARPHWGKIHHRDAAELQTLYPRFSDFLAMRDRLDPNRVFANDYTKQVFGD
jgi:FAD-linked oxidoreductase